MKLRRLFYLAPTVLLLQGCWFVFVPGSLIDATADGLSGARGKHCVASTAKVGDWISVNGTTWRVKTLEGSSYRCKNPEMPIRAELEPA